ncbi:hypothetical protein OIU77_009237 [Salix suchowensis]|uniref:Uncharacterized protein n=1 Tax=Salix suchowensis TaxID=1278906 RepID=A0ABQ9ADM4_9ROSI|nr:hypothetical protein OIU77_009237 [Salix suchowensis]
MLMMFQQLVKVCQVMVIISFSSSITSLASLLHPGEGKNNLPGYMHAQPLFSVFTDLY